MPSNYPNSIDTFTTKIDNVDTVMASHINNLQDSVIAIQQTVGAPPAMIAGRIPRAESIRGSGIVIPLTGGAIKNDFSSLTQSGWQWATGSGFVEPSSKGIWSETWLRVHSMPSNARAFFFKSAVTVKNYVGRFGLNATTNLELGVRLDNGTANTYIETRCRIFGSMGEGLTIIQAYDTGTGTETAATANLTFAVPFHCLIGFFLTGTLWTNWGFHALLGTTQIMRPTPSVSGFTWTPTRAGIVLRQATADWSIGIIDLYAEA